MPVLVRARSACIPTRHRRSARWFRNPLAGKAAHGAAAKCWNQKRRWLAARVSRGTAEPDIALPMAATAATPREATRTGSAPPKAPRPQPPHGSPPPKDHPHDPRHKQSFSIAPPQVCESDESDHRKHEEKGLGVGHAAFVPSGE